MKKEHCPINYLQQKAYIYILSILKFLWATKYSVNM